MSLYEIIIQKLNEALSPLEVKVIDESNQHIGHAGSRAGGETHFAVIVISTKFRNLSRMQRHKLIYGILDTEMKENIHALSISALTPEEI